MRIEITPGTVRIWHGLNNEGKMALMFTTNDHITVDVDANVNPNDLEFRTGRFVGYPGTPDEVVKFERQRADLVVRGED